MEIRETEFAGFGAIELIASGTRLVVVTAVGPRIAFFGRAGGENLLFWDREGAHRNGDWRLYGGHRLWVTRPGADESEEVHAPDNEPCHVERLDGGVRVVSANRALAIERALTIRSTGDTWNVEHRLHNTGSVLWSGGAWPLTCTLPGPDTMYRIPLGGGPASWDITTIVIPQRWGSHTSRLDDPQITLTSDAMEIRAHRDEAKRMVLAPQGTIEMYDPTRGLFRKVTPYDPTATYPLATNLAVYVGPARFMVEMESMSPLRTLVPGSSLTHVEHWSLEAL